MTVSEVLSGSFGSPGARLSVTMRAMAASSAARPPSKSGMTLL